MESTMANEIRKVLFESKQITPWELVLRFKERITSNEEKETFCALVSKIGEIKRNDSSSELGFIVLKESERLHWILASEVNSISVRAPLEKQDELMKLRKLTNMSMIQMLYLSNMIQDMSVPDKTSTSGQSEKPSSCIQKTLKTRNDLKSVIAKPATAPASGTRALNGGERTTSLMEKQVTIDHWETKQDELKKLSKASYYSDEEKHEEETIFSTVTNSIQNDVMKHKSPVESFPASAKRASFVPLLGTKTLPAKSSSVKRRRNESNSEPSSPVHKKLKIKNDNIAFLDIQGKISNIQKIANSQDVVLLKESEFLYTLLCLEFSHLSIY